MMPLNNNMVLINSNNGRSFGDNPRAIFEELVHQKRRLEYVIVSDNDLSNSLKEENIHTVRYMSLKYLFYLATSKYWIININAYSGSVPRKKQVFVQTWHGTPLKRIGNDIIDSRKQEKLEWAKDASNWSYFISNAQISNANYESAFNLSGKKILAYGLPRNDRLVNDTTIKDDFRKHRNIAKDKKIILYAPTYRDDHKPIEFDYELFSEKLSDKYYLLINYHRLYQFDTKSKFDNIEVNSTLTIEECMKISDILITDYSSVFFDYSMLDKPMIFFPYDLEDYRNKNRGFYYDYEDLVPGDICYDMGSLIDTLKKQDFMSLRHSKEFAKRFNANYSQRNATKKVIDKIFGEIR